MAKPLGKLIWYEKYRAHKLGDMVLPKEMRKKFRYYLKQEQIPHLLFHGPAGSGKTTLAHILIGECASASLILNASSADRGIGVIKGRVKQFASSQRADAGRLNIVLFDEADGLTADAQMALKNTIEAYHKNCRFIFTTNSIDKIIEPIASRCTLFKFDSLPMDDVTEMMGSILDDEEVEYKQGALEYIVEHFYPDVRSIINNIQAASVSGELELGDALVTLLDTTTLMEHLDRCNIGAIRELIAGMTDFVWLYKFLFHKFLNTVKIDKRADVAVVIAEYLYRDSTVTDREINMTACLADMFTTMGEGKIKW